MQVISSKDNELVKKVKKLKEKKYRDEENAFIVEGIKMVEEAIDENAKIQLIVICEECINNGTLNKEIMYKIAKHECIYVTEKIFNLLTDVKTPQGILAVIGKKGKNTEIDYSKDIIIALDGIQDPGNLGTILRTVDSANLGQIIISKNSADCYNTKVVRSTMGAIFRVKIVECEDLKQTLKRLQENNFKVMVTDLGTDKSIYDIKLQKNVIVIGNEANGVSKEIKKIADTKAIIPMLGKTESLNASIATGVILYEYVRQKLQEK